MSNYLNNTNNEIITSSKLLSERIVSDKPAVLHCKKLEKQFHDGEHALHILRGIDLLITPGEWVSIVGKSGSGKSTFLQVIAGLDQPSSGEVIWSGDTITGKKVGDIAKIRRKHLGFVFQFHHLIGECSALENVSIPLLVQGASASKARKAAQMWLQRVGLESRQTHRPSELSGGERQRVAIARALVTQPTCILADEPTGNLDEETSAEIQELLQNMNREHGVSLLVVTHDLAFAQRANRCLRMELGHLHV
ncbi:MAG: ABC transporter ATP-binding protein [Pseudomonadota bacterium]